MVSAPVISRIAPQSAISFAEAAEQSIRTPLLEILRHWDAVRNGNDPDAVHDMRVATRRLRAALAVFESAFSDKLFQRFEKKIAYLTDALGEARDTDVFLEFLQAEAANLEPSRECERAGLETYISSLQRLRSVQQEELLKTLRRLDPAQLAKDADNLLDELPVAHLSVIEGEAK